MVLKNQSEKFSENSVKYSDIFIKCFKKFAAFLKMKKVLMCTNILGNEGGCMWFKCYRWHSPDVG
jgi:hypothetical protein